MVLAEAMGAKLTDITPNVGDTNDPSCNGQTASETACGVSFASVSAAAAAKQQLLAAASSQPRHTRQQPHHEEQHSREHDDGRRCSVLPIMAKLGTPITVVGTHPLYTTIPAVRPAGNVSTGYALGACFAEVNVDIWNGKVTVVQIVLLRDYGQVVNLFAVENNMVGGIMQALGHAVTEEYVMDVNTSQIITRGFLRTTGPELHGGSKDYVGTDPEPRPQDALRNKGGGEAPVCVPHGAILNAIANATGLGLQQYR